MALRVGGYIRSMAKACKGLEYKNLQVFESFAVVL